jgi:hypothetical protein
MMGQIASRTSFKSCCTFTGAVQLRTVVQAGQ